MATRAVLVALACGALLLVSSCSSDNQHSAPPGQGVGGSSNSGPISGPPTGGTQPVVLRAPAGTDAATMTAAADIVRSRLARMGVTNTAVNAQDDGVTVRSSADGYQLRAAAQRHATTIAPITSSAVGPCNGAGAPSVGPPARCSVLGGALTGVTAITNAAIQNTSGAGWKVTFAIAPDQYRTFRAALEPIGNGTLALVTDDAVALAFRSGVPALQSAIGPPLAEDQARQAAAALAVDTDLPIDLAAPPLPAPSGARVDLDFWTAPLGVNICGTWLANAPGAGLNSGVHSHGDGLVYIHPFNPAEAGDNATIGLFLQQGGWNASENALKLWDGTEHVAGTACPNGQTAQVRWWVDGVEQHGDPAKLAPRNGQLVVLSFDSNPDPPGEPPQLNALTPPALGAAT